MVGSGSPTFAVWSYVLANMKPDKFVGAQVELNPKLLAFLLGEKEEEVIKVVTKLCSPDQNSRSREQDGRRMVRLGEFTYQVVNGAKYRAIRSADERREYHRDYQRKRRGKVAQPDGKPGNMPNIPFEVPAVVEPAQPDVAGVDEPVEMSVMVRLQALKKRLEAYWTRPPDAPWDYLEEHKLLEIAKRPSCKEELDIILAHYKSLPGDKKQYYPMASVIKLLEGWTKLLDTARMASGVNPGDPDAKARGDALWEKMAPAFAKGIGDQFRVNP